MKASVFFLSALAMLGAAAPSGAEDAQDLEARQQQSQSQKNYYDNGPGHNNQPPPPSYWQNNYKPRPPPAPSVRYNFPAPPPPPNPSDVTVYQINQLFVQVNIFEVGSQCKPGSYACVNKPGSGQSGWATCNQQGRYVYSCDCPPTTTCGLLSGLSPVCWPFGSQPNE